MHSGAHQRIAFEDRELDEQISALCEDVYVHKRIHTCIQGRIKGQTWKTRS